MHADIEVRKLNKRYLFFANEPLIWLHLTLCKLKFAHKFPSCLFSSVEPVGGWFIPSTGSLCPPASPHSQFGSPISLSPSHGCERYSTLRNHRSAPYTSPYAHRTNSPSECPPPTFTFMHPGITPLPPWLLTRNSNKCCWAWDVLHSSGFCVSGATGL